MASYEIVPNRCVWDREMPNRGQEVITISVERCCYISNINNDNI